MDKRIDVMIDSAGKLSLGGELVQKQTTEKEAVAAIRKLLQDARTIAIVGLSAKADRPSNEVAHRLQRAGYTIIPVNPA